MLYTIIDQYFSLLFSPVTSLFSTISTYYSLNSFFESDLFYLIGFYIFALIAILNLTEKTISNSGFGFSALKGIFKALGYTYIGYVVFTIWSNTLLSDYYDIIFVRTYFGPIVIILFSIVVGSVYFNSLVSTPNIATLGKPFFPVLISSLYLLSSGNRNLIQLFVLILFVSVCFYFLLAETKRASALESAIKYYSLGLLASSFMLFGILMIYGELSSVDYNEIKVLGSLKAVFNGGLAQPTVLEILGIIFIVFGLLFKLSVFPLHIWVSDVYEGAGTRVLLLMATILKVAIALAMSELLGVFSYLQEQVWTPLLIIAGIGSLVVGSFGGILQQKIKRLLAFSSINHMGFLVLGFASSSDIFFSSFFYLIIYITSVVVFLGTVLMFRRTNGSSITYLTDLNQIWFYQPARVRLLIFVSLFTMAGLPPFALFFSKFTIMLQSTYSSYGLIGLVFMLGLLVVSIFNYLRVIKYMCFRIDAPTNTLAIITTNTQIIFMWFLVTILIMSSVFLFPILESFVSIRIFDQIL